MGTPLLNAVDGQKPREIAADVLNRKTESSNPGPVQAHAHRYIEDLLDACLSRAQLSSADRRLCQELVYGVVRWRAALDWLIARKIQRKNPKQHLQNLLRLGLYQIFWLERIPNHAAVHETVQLVKRAGLHSQAGLVNAVLRGYLREFEATRQLLNELKTSQADIGFSHPQWLVERWTDRWDMQRTVQLMQWNNTAPKSIARVNLLKTDPGKLLAQWRDENVEYNFVRRNWFEENLVFEITSQRSFRDLPSFQQGFFYLQDPSTLLAVRMLDPRPGETVLDMCAAPGGKLSFIAQLMKNQGSLVAHDTAADRLKMTEENCSRLGIICDITATLPSCSPGGKFHRILVDAPCSNTGVIRRRVELRWRIRAEEIARLRSLQLELLRRAANLLLPEGALVYSTCSLEPEENSSVVAQFLRERNEFKVQAERELLPFVNEVDGAYVALLKAGQ